MDHNREVNPCIYGQLIYNGSKSIQGERTVSSMNGVGKTRQPLQKNETGPLSYTIDKN